MGASAAGKTTLLNCLSGRDYNFTGKVRINGESISDRKASSWLKRSAYIQQTDAFFKEMTVFEHLTFQAKMRLKKQPHHQPDHLQNVVEKVILELGLTKVRDNKIGQVGLGGISGGERRRLSVATELLTNPTLLFVDEPTSGLDSFMAEEVILQLRRLAKSKHRTIICTIHQPSSEVYALFDEVMYLSQGRTAYLGPVSSAVKYFGSIDSKFVCPSFSNPSDFFIKMLAILPADMERSTKQVERLLDYYETSDRKNQVDQRIATMQNQIPNTNTNMITTSKEKGQHRSSNSTSNSSSPSSWHHHHHLHGIGSNDYVVSGWQQFKSLLWRAAITQVRDPMLFQARMFMSIVLAVLVGLIYLQVGNGQSSVQNKTGALFFILLNQSMQNVMGTLNIFPLEIAVFKREYAARMYRSDIYFLAKNVAELPLQLLFPTIFFSISYWMIGFRNDGAVFVEILLILLLVSQSALSLGYAVSAGAPSVQVALVIGPLVLMPFMLFGGLLINASSIPSYFYWLSYTSFFKYGYEAVNVVLWDGANLDCPTAPGASCFYPSGDAILQQYSFSKDNMARDIGALFALLVGFRLIALYFLHKRASAARKY